MHSRIIGRMLSQLAAGSRASIHIANFVQDASSVSAGARNCVALACSYQPYLL